MSIYSHNKKIDRIKSSNKVIGKVYSHNQVIYDITGITPGQHRISVISDEPIDGAGVYNNGELCTLSVPEGTTGLEGWYINGVKVGSGNEYSFVVNADITVTANFSDPYVGTVLYQHPTGTGGTITFSESIANYAYVEFIGTNGICKIIPGNYTGAITFNNKFITSNPLSPVGSREHFYERDWRYTLTTTTLTPSSNTIGYEGQKVHYGDIKYDSNNRLNYFNPHEYTRNSTTNGILIRKVIGYKSVDATVVYNASSPNPITTSKSISTNDYVLAIGRSVNDISSSFCQYVNSFNLIAKRIFGGGWYYCDETLCAWTISGNTVSRSEFYLRRERASSATAVSNRHQYVYSNNQSSTYNEVVDRPINTIITTDTLSSHATVLLDNPDPASSYTLSDDATNYDIIQVYYKSSAAPSISSSVRLVYTEVGDFIPLFSTFKDSTGTMFVQQVICYNWDSPTVLSIRGHPPIQLWGNANKQESWVSTDLGLQCYNYVKSFSDIKIQKIVGYKGHYLF